MRLTLRTLLGWIDGVLPPDKQELIGERVPGSELAMGLCARIRRAVAEGTDRPGIDGDPNLVAEYLDNTLATADLPAFEKLCIESEPHLVDVASCHNMLADIFHGPRVAMLTRERRHGLRQKLRTRMSAETSSPAAVPVRLTPRTDPTAAPLPRPAANAGDASPRTAVAALSSPPPAAASAAVQPTPPPASEPQQQQDYADAKAAAGALVHATLQRPQRPTPQRHDGEPQERIAAPGDRVESPSPQAAWPAAARPDAGGFAASPNEKPFLDSPLSPGSPVVDASVVALPRSTALKSWTTWVAAGLALMVLLAAGGALSSVFRGPRTYAPEPGCMYCTQR